MRRTGPDHKTRQAVYERSRLRCERCGTHPDISSVHHRLPRGRGGDNRLSNLVLVCDFGGCHGTVESQRARAYETGWLILTGHNPAATPILRHDGWALLNDDGTLDPITEADAARIMDGDVA